MYRICMIIQKLKDFYLFQFSHPNYHKQLKQITHASSFIVFGGEKYGIIVVLWAFIIGEQLYFFLVTLDGMVLKQTTLKGADCTIPQAYLLKHLERTKFLKA